MNELKILEKKKEIENCKWTYGEIQQLDKDMGLQPGTMEDVHQKAQARITQLESEIQELEKHLTPSSVTINFD